MASTAIASTGNYPLGVRATVRYRGFVLIPQADFTWLVRQGRLKVRHRAAGAATLVPVLSGLLPSVGRLRCQC